MSKIDYEKYDNLYEKIRERLDGDILNEGEEQDYLSALDLDYIARRSIAPYNAILRTKVEEDVKKLNRIAKRSRLLKKRVPNISGMTSSIDEKGNKSIIVTFSYGGRCVGIATINRDLTVNIEFLRAEFSEKETMSMLSRNHSNYMMYFNALDSFSLDYPGIGYEFGTEGTHYNSYQDLNDGFLEIRIDLNGPWDTKASFVKLEDLNIARTKVPKYGELYDYIETYNESILRHFRVDEEKLNPLFRSMVEKQREFDRQEPQAKRVLTV